MNNENTKLSVNMAPGENKLVLAGDYIQLEDKTSDRFVTTDYDSFVTYLGKKSEDETIKFNLFANAGKVDAIQQGDLNYFTREFASLNLTEHPVIDIIRNANKIPTELKDFTSFLKRVRKYCTADALDMLSQLEDLKIRKVIDIDQQSDGRGNFVFSVRADKGSQDYEFPETISLRLPVYEQFLEDVVDFEFNFFFKWEVKEDQSVKMTVIVENIELELQLKEAKAEILNAKFSDFKDFYLGSCEIKPETDKSLYMKNEAVLKS